MNLDYTRAEGISATESRNLTTTPVMATSCMLSVARLLGDPLRLPPVFGFVVFHSLVHLSVTDLEHAASHTGKQMGHGRNRFGRRGRTQSAKFGPSSMTGRVADQQEAGPVARTHRSVVSALLRKPKQLQRDHDVYGP